MQNDILLINFSLNFFSFNYFHFLIFCKKKMMPTFQLFVFFVILNFNLFNKIDGMENSTISLPLLENYGEKCPNNGRFNGIEISALAFNIDFHFKNFENLLLENEDNGRLSFFVCYKSNINKKLLKPQFKLRNNLDNVIGKYCGQQESKRGFRIDFGVENENKLKMEISFSFSEEKWNFKSENNFLLNQKINLQLKFGQNFVQIFHGNGLMMKNRIFQFGEGKFRKYFLFDGNKMMQNNLSPWFILVDSAPIRDEKNANMNSTNQQQFQIHHKNFCSVGTEKSKNWLNEGERSIQIKCRKCESGEQFSCNECGIKCDCRKKEHRNNPNQVTFISGGEKVDDAEKWPWLIALHSYFLVTKRENGQNETIGPFQCSGSIIHKEFVLTAAHCVKKIPEKKYSWAELSRLEIYMGQKNILNAKSIDIDPKNAFPNPRFFEFITVDNFRFQNLNLDIALLKLSKPLEFNEKIIPICLFENLNLPKNAILHIAGWGFSQEADFNPPISNEIPVEENLHESTVRILSVEDCLELERENCLFSLQFMDPCMKSKEKLFKSKFCVQGEKDSTLQGGDSGSPLMYLDPKKGRWFNIGVASRQFLRKSPLQKPLPGWQI